MTLGSSIFFGGIAVLLVVVAAWARRRAERIRVEAEDREMNALALLHAGKDPVPEKGAESEFVGGLSARIPPKGGVELAEVVDIDELLRGEPVAVAGRARTRLQDSASASVDLNAYAPRLSPGARTTRGPVATAAPAADAAPPVAASAAGLTPTERAINQIVANASAHESHQGAVDQASTDRRSDNLPDGPTDNPTDNPLDKPIARPIERIDERIHRPAHGAVTTSEPDARVPTQSSTSTPSADSVAGVTPAPKTTAQINVDVPLRELSLAWFEARGYRGAPASPAVRPIELVLRHKDDPARAYAFVVEPQPVDGSRVTALLRQAREIGLLRVLIVADAGADQTAAAGKKGARVIDRPAMDEEFRKLDLGVAAKIIAVARKRAASRLTV